MSKTHREDTSGPQIRPHNQSSAMPGEDVLDDRKPQTRPLLGATVLDIDAIEALREPRHVFRRDARTVIAHADFR